MMKQYTPEAQAFARRVGELIRQSDIARKTGKKSLRQIERIMPLDEYWQATFAALNDAIRQARQELGTPSDYTESLGRFKPSENGATHNGHTNE